MSNVIKWMMDPPVNNSNANIILRMMAGGVFFWEGILKFVFTNQGVGRFTKLGFPMPEMTADFVASFEIIGGLFLLLGLFTRLTAFLFIVEMIVAILTTKVSLYLGTSPLPLPPSPPKVGLGAVLHEGRADYAQLLVSLYLLLEGPGRRSLDHFFSVQKMKREQVV